MSELIIRNLSVRLRDNGTILKDVNLSIKSGELHVVMGPNGSGKTSLALAIMGDPRYIIEEGEILLNGTPITDLPMEERAKRGLFLSYQAPPEIPMVRFENLLRESLNIRNKRVTIELLTKAIQRIGLREEHLKRETYVGFSGGERKRGEMLQLLLLKPEFAILDEPDTGVDVDSLPLIADAIKDALTMGVGIILITHYARILEYFPNNYWVHVILNGTIRAHGGPELAKEIEKKGFRVIKND